MNAKQLAEGMIDGSLGYAPEDDAHFIAESYLKMHEQLTQILQLSIHGFPVNGAIIGCLECQERDPAKS